MSQPVDDLVPMTPRRMLLGVCAAIALPVFFALSGWLFPATKLLDDGSLEPESQVAVDAFIHQWDADHDGVISRDELKSAIGNRLDHMIEKLFHAADKNRDGRLDRNELNSVAGENFSWLLRTSRKPLS